MHKRLQWILIAFVVLFAGAVRAQSQMIPSPEAPELCIQNFNVYGPIYASGVAERTERFTGFLQALPKCDVVQFQEAWNSSQITQIEKNLSHQYRMSTPNKEARIGLMSLFMGEILGHQTVTFRVNNEGGFMDSVRDALKVKKAYHVVKTRFHFAEEEFFFMNTHLHPSSTSVRLTQILDLLQWRLQNSGLKLILTGDFNSDIPSFERQFLMRTLGMRDAMEEYLGVYPKDYCTYCAGNPLGWTTSSHTFDYVFFSNVGSAATSLRVTHGEVNMRGTSRQPWSDHFGVRVKIAISEVQALPLRSQQDVRVQEALKVLQEAQVVLRKEKSAEFKPYVSLARDLVAQLQNQQGPFFDYLMSYR